MYDCWQCGGEGNLGSDCIDDCCYGGDVPCYHGDEDTIRCDVCGGSGLIGGEDDYDPEDCEVEDGTNDG